MSTYIVAFVVIRLEECIHSWWEEYFVIVRRCFPQGKYVLSIAQVIMLLENYKEIMYELPRLVRVDVTNLQFLAMENRCIVTEKEVMIPMFLLDIMYWNYDTLFQVKVSSLLLKRDPDLMLTHTNRPNLTNCVGVMIY